jgi:hypothetical protein
MRIMSSKNCDKAHAGPKLRQKEKRKISAANQNTQTSRGMNNLKIFMLQRLVPSVEEN